MPGGPSEGVLGAGVGPLGHASVDVENPEGGEDVDDDEDGAAAGGLADGPDDVDAVAEEAGTEHGGATDCDSPAFSTGLPW